MPWGRFILGAVITLLIVSGVVLVTLQMSRVWNIDAGSAPFAGAVDREMLAGPFNDIRMGRDAALIEDMVPELDRAEAQRQIDHIQTLLPANQTPESRLMNWRIT